MEITFLFKTYFLIAWGFLWGLVYCAALISDGRKGTVSSIDFIAVALSSISFISGFKLIFMTFTTAVHLNTELEMDKVFTSYGGFCVMWIGVRGVYARIRRQ